MEINKEINISDSEESSFSANRFTIGIRLKEGKRFRWPLHAMREWSLSPASGQGILKIPEKLKIVVGQYELIVSGNHLGIIDKVFCEGNGGDIIEQGDRYIEVATAKPFVSKIEIRDTTGIL